MPKHTKASAQGLGPRDNDHDKKHQRHSPDAAPRVGHPGHDVWHISRASESTLHQVRVSNDIDNNHHLSHTYLLQHQE
jgi:hypothetical protein